MENTMSLFGSEFSLFGEDLLFSPTVLVNEGVVTASQDGLKGNPLSTGLAWPTGEELGMGQNVLSSQQIPDDLLEEWLDQPIDLLDLVDGEQSFDEFNLEIEDATRLQALHMEVEKNSLELNTKKALEELVGDSPQEIPCPASENVYDQGLRLLELLPPPDSSDSEFEHNDIATLGLDQAMNYSDTILSGMSLEDVEIILSSGPSSPESLVTEESLDSFMSTVVTAEDSLPNILSEVSMEEDNTETVNWAIVNEMGVSKLITDVICTEKNMKPRVAPKKRVGKRASSKSKTDTESSDSCGVVHITDRKLRKKQQNKDAATRYRIKKKYEQQVINKDVDILESHNIKLKDKVDQMTKEIQYLKTLIADVYVARTHKSTKSK